MTLCKCILGLTLTGGKIVVLDGLLDTMMMIDLYAQILSFYATYYKR